MRDPAACPARLRDGFRQDILAMQVCRTCGPSSPRECTVHTDLCGTDLCGNAGANGLSEVLALQHSALETSTPFPSETTPHQPELRGRSLLLLLP
jgi:hypothetical protein